QERQTDPVASGVDNRIDRILRTVNEAHSAPDEAIDRGPDDHLATANRRNEVGGHDGGAFQDPASGPGPGRRHGPQFSSNSKGVAAARHAPGHSVTWRTD